MLRRLLILTCVLGLVPSSALSTPPGQLHQNPAQALAPVQDVVDAIEDAAAEFWVPAPLLHAIAYTEGRYQHHPHRVAASGRRGLLQLSPQRQDEAANLLGTSTAEINSNHRSHIRGFAALLDARRPVDLALGPSTASIGRWGDALIGAIDMPGSYGPAYVDRIFRRIRNGAIDRLPTGEAIGFPPAPIASEYLGQYAMSVERSPDYPGAAWSQAASCNYTNASRSVGDVQWVVIHTAQGTYGGTISWFQNCASQVSAHYVVSMTGEVTQMLYEEDTGWHAGNWSYNQGSIGIEHEGYVDQSHPSGYPSLAYLDNSYTPAMYAASAALVAEILADWNLPGNRNTVIAHTEVPLATHTDPGPLWDWDHYMDLINGTVSGDDDDVADDDDTVAPETGTLVGYIRHTDLFEPSYGINDATVDIDGIGGVAADETGYYLFEDVLPGSWTVCAKAPGYYETCEDKVVEANITNWKSMLLEIDPNSDDDDASSDDDDDTEDDDDAADDDDGTGDDDDAADDDAADDDDSADAQAAGAAGPRWKACTCLLADAPSPLAPSSAALALGLLLLTAGLRRRGRRPQSAPQRSPS